MKLKLLMIALLITISSYSQQSYPKQIVLNKDTVIAITPEQLRESNRKFIALDWYQDKDSINTKKIENQSLVIIKDSLSKINMIEKVRLMEENFATISKENDKNVVKLNKSIKISKAKDWGIGTLLIGLVIAICL